MHKHASANIEAARSTSSKKNDDVDTDMLSSVPLNSFSDDEQNIEHSESLHSVLPSSMVADEDSDKEMRLIYEATLNRISAYALGISMAILAALSTVLDFYDQSYHLIPPLIGVCLLSIISVLLLKDKKRNPMISLLMLGCTLTALCFYVLICDGPADGSTKLWVAIFPSTVVLCMGLRYGAIAFAFLYTFMLGLFFTPLGSIMAVPLTEPMQTRFLLVCLGSFCFVWFFEYARFKTNLAWNLAAYNIEQTSLTDTLTGLGNRRDFDRSLKWTMARTERTSSVYSLAILDIDHFKRVNDTYGHAVGDDVLKHIAREVGTQIRTADRIFRWGGEEFTIIMPSTPMEKAVAGAERVRKHIEQTPFNLGGERIYLTVSLGIYSGMETADAAYPLHVADQCLYRAKSSGRNKVVSNCNT